MINKNYLLLVHNSPSQVLELIEALNDGDSSFFIHVDLKSNLEDFINVIKGNRIFFTSNRYDCVWGDYSQVLATIAVIQDSLKYNKSAQFSILLSGQDFPIVSKNRINSFFSENRKYNYINFDNLKKDDFHFYVERLNYLKVNISSKRQDFLLVPDFKLKNLREIYRALKKLRYRNKLSFDLLKNLMLRRKPFKDFELGQCWWSINNETLEKIFNYYLLNKNKLDQYFKYVLCSDETFFQTILINLMKKDKEILIKRSITYTNWSRDTLDLPVTFIDNNEDLEELKKASENFLFARKFNDTNSKKLREYFFKLDN